MDMEPILWGVSFLLAMAVGVLSFYLWRFRRQVNHISEQLEFLETEDSNFLLTSVCAVGKTPEMINHINHVLEQLRQEQRRLRRTNKSYRESITGISHDIRTPLTSVKGYVQILHKTELTHEKRTEYTRIVERRLEELSNMLNQLFEYARIEAGELVLNMEKVNAGNLFTEIISMFYEDFLKKGCEPEIEIGPKALFIQADRHAFSRILENLIKNALVHGKGKYHFCLHSKERMAVLLASNETDSIEESDLERIFERFYTTDLSRSRRTTGLGLAIAKELTEQMGGTIRAYFEREYFTVEVCLPLIMMERS